MLTVSVSSNIKEVFEEFDALTDELKTKSVVRALNRTAEAAKVQSAREIAAQGYKLKAAVIKSKLKVIKASAQRKTATIIVRGRPIPLIEFAARQTAKGVTVSVKNGRKLIPGAFIATMTTGHVGVFMRKGNGRKPIMRKGKKDTSGLPVEEKFGPGVDSMFSNAQVQAAIDRMIDERFAGILRGEVKYRLG